jgi:hypothetical protein
MDDAPGVQSADRLLLPEAERTLAALDDSPVDAAARRMLTVYARQIDDAKRAETHADAVLRRAAKAGADETLLEQISALRLKLAARTAVSDVGPKFVALLAELKATPAARAKLARNAGAPAPAGGSLARLRSTGA